jgi:hypothetical protein
VPSRDIGMTNTRRFGDTRTVKFSYCRLMICRYPLSRPHVSGLRIVGFVVAILFGNLNSSRAQDSPLLSGGAGFLTQTTAGNTTYIPTIAPVLEFPITDRFLIESKANLLEAVFPRPGHGYDTSHYVALAYLQGDFQANSHATVTGGYFYTPFNTFNERLSPIWINNFTDGPLISSIGVGSSTGSILGGMIRGNAFHNASASITYDFYLSANSANEQFSSTRLAGSRVSFYLPRSGLEGGASFNRVLQGRHSSNTGVHLWWTPPGSRFRFRSEYAHAVASEGYWFELASQLAGSADNASLIARVEPVFRFQQTFRSKPDATDGLPGANTQRADFGLNYRLRNELRINTSYSRRFSTTGNANIWQSGLVYRFLFPAWRSK